MKSEYQTLKQVCEFNHQNKQQLYGPQREKTCLRGLQTTQAQTSICAV